MEQQTALSNRHGKLGSVLERAENFGLETEDAPSSPLDTIEPEKRADASDAFKEILTAPKTAKTRGADFAMLGSTLAYAPENQSMADRADLLFSRVTLSLKSIENDQMAHIQSLTANAAARAAKIGKILKNTGVAVSEKTASLDIDLDDDSAIGGPYAEPQLGDRFEATLAELDTALDRLERVRKFARKLPFSNPAPGKTITSTYGNRVDPFFGKLAMHAGIDFRQPIGGKIVATGAGKVIHAGPAGGYGIMIEIDHGNGITTRYGHLSRTLVKVGDWVETGSEIAFSGSTGRSTGPHLHYEVRRNGMAVDPMRFLNAGMKLTKYLD
jgi:murein DD-endopeptidase MepM/ murein hydrolase activator NlpD